MEIFGWGKKNTADVTPKGELKTYAESFSTDYDAAQDGDAYILDIDGVTVGADGNTLVMLENSHSSWDMVVTDFRLTPNASAGKDDQEIEVYIGGAFTFLAEGTAVTPANVLASKNGGAPGGVAKSFYVSDGTADTLTTITAGTIAGRFAMPSRKEYDCSVPSAWHIPPGSCFYLTAAKDEKFRGFIAFYYKEKKA